MFTTRRFGTAIIAAALAAAPLAAQQQEVQIRTIPIGSGVYMLVGQGGNIGLSVGPDGAFLVDDQYAPLTPKIEAAVAALTDKPIRFVINTHWHGDHTGGNENLGKAGAIIVAHENVRKRMSAEQFIAAFNSRTPPAPPAALPVITFTQGVTFHWNGGEIDVFRVQPAHTDGDAVIHFRAANAIHMGDTYFNGMYPFIDASTGGSLDGMVAAADRVLALSDANTKIIPGHGPLSTAAELRAFRNMLTDVGRQVRRLLAEGKTRDQVIAAKPTTAYDAKWGSGFLQPDVWVGILVDAAAKP